MQYRGKSTLERGDSMCKGPEAAESLSCLQIKGRQHLGGVSEGKDTGEIKSSRVLTVYDFENHREQSDLTLRAVGSLGGF